MFRFQLRLNPRGIIIIAALLLSGGSAFAEEDFASANYMMRGCRDAVALRENFLSGACMGTVDGLVFAARNREICALSQVTVEQLLRVVVQYIDGRPARMHEDFKKLAAEALMAAWPCEKLAYPSK
jgi:hypothetical protein